MTELSNVVGKPVLNIATSCIIGKVSDVYFDEYLKNAVYFLIATDGGDRMLEYAEAKSNLDALVIADDINLKYPADVDTTVLHGGLLGMGVYTPTGIDKGRISDIHISSAGKVAKLQATGGEFLPSAITSVGNVILQKGAQKSKPRKLSIPKPAEDYPVYILNDTEKVLEIEKAILKGEVPILNSETAVIMDKAPVINNEALRGEAPEKEPVLSNGAFEVLLDGSKAYSYDEDAHTPTRVICDYEFLLGRTLGADLCTYTGELIAKQDSVVTDSVVEKARRAGKLVELTLNSIKPNGQN